MIKKEVIFIFGGIALTYYLLRERIWEGPKNKNRKV